MVSFSVGCEFSGSEQRVLVGFRVQSSGFIFSGFLGFRVLVGFRVQGLGFRAGLKLRCVWRFKVRSCLVKFSFRVGMFTFGVELGCMVFGLTVHSSGSGAALGVGSV